MGNTDAGPRYSLGTVGAHLLGSGSDSTWSASAPSQSLTEGHYLLKLNFCPALDAEHFGKTALLYLTASTLPPVLTTLPLPVTETNIRTA